MQSCIQLPLVMLLAGAGLAQAAGDNVLVNSTFDNDFAGWSIGAPDNKPGGGNVKAVAGAVGHYACITAQTEARSTYLIQKIDPERIRGKLLLLRARVKTENVKKGPYSYSTARILLEGDGRTIGVLTFLGTREWTDVSEMWQVGADCKTTTFYIGMHTSTGTMMVDNLELLALDEPEYGRTLAPGIQECRFGDAPALKIGERFSFEVKPCLPSSDYQPDSAERERGFVPFQVDEPADIVAGRKPLRAEVDALRDGLRVRACAGQVEEVYFAVAGLRAAESLTLKAGDFRGPRMIPASVIDIRLGRQVIQRYGGYHSSKHETTPKLLETARPTPFDPAVSELFWLVLRLPADSAPGEYVADLELAADGRTQTLPLRLQILPFALAPSHPWMFFFYERKPDNALTYFQDMRDHGMTSVILACVQAPLELDEGRPVMDFTTSNAFVDAYRRAGFTDPLCYNPFHDRLGTILLQLAGRADQYRQAVNYGETICLFDGTKYPCDLQETYKQIIRLVHDNARKNNWPDYYYFAVDEPESPNQSGPDSWRLSAARLEYRLVREAVPEMKTMCTAYHLDAIRLLEPYLDLPLVTISSLTANTDHQEYRRVMGKHGGGKDLWGIGWPPIWNDFYRSRFLAGFLPAAAGCNGMTAWTYYRPRQWKDEYNDLRGRTKPCVFAYLDDEGNPVPTLPFEGIRAGINDWRFVRTLKERLAATPEDTPARESAQNVLKEVLGFISSDDSRLMNLETSIAEEVPAKWRNRKAQHLRDRLIDAILELAPL